MKSSSQAPAYANIEPWSFKLMSKPESLDNEIVVMADTAEGHSEPTRLSRTALDVSMCNGAASAISMDVVPSSHEAKQAADNKPTKEDPVAMNPAHAGVASVCSPGVESDQGSDQGIPDGENEVPGFQNTPIVPRNQEGEVGSNFEAATHEPFLTKTMESRALSNNPALFPDKMGPDCLSIISQWKEIFPALIHPCGTNTSSSTLVKARKGQHIAWVYCKENDAEVGILGARVYNLDGGTLSVSAGRSKTRVIVVRNHTVGPWLVALHRRDPVAHDTTHYRIYVGLNHGRESYRPGFFVKRVILPAKQQLQIAAPKHARADDDLQNPDCSRCGQPTREYSCYFPFTDRPLCSGCYFRRRNIDFSQPNSMGSHPHKTASSNSMLAELLAVESRTLDGIQNSNRHDSRLVPTKPATQNHQGDVFVSPQVKHNPVSGYSPVPQRVFDSNTIPFSTSLLIKLSQRPRRRNGQ